MFNSELSTIYLLMGYMINTKGLLLSSYLPNILQANLSTIRITSLKFIVFFVPLSMVIIVVSFTNYTNDWLLLASWFLSMIGFGLESTYSIALKRPDHMLWASGFVCACSLWLWKVFGLSVSMLLLYFIFAEILIGFFLFTLNRVYGVRK